MNASLSRCLAGAGIMDAPDAGGRVGSGWRQRRVAHIIQGKSHPPREVCGMEMAFDDVAGAQSHEPWDSCPAPLANPAEALEDSDARPGIAVVTQCESHASGDSGRARLEESPRGGDFSPMIVPQSHGRREVCGMAASFCEPAGEESPEAWDCCNLSPGNDRGARGQSHAGGDSCVSRPWNAGKTFSSPPTFPRRRGAAWSFFVIHSSSP